MPVTPVPLPAGDKIRDAEVIARYRARYRRQDLAFGLFDKFLGVFVHSRVKSDSGQPRRILLANAGHLGDAIISTGLLPVLKAAFPDACLGFLAGSCSRPVLEDHPLLDQTHYLDHWYTSRHSAPRLAKAYQYYRYSRPAMVRELRAAGYDAALDLHAWVPNFIPLLWQAGIPTRIGFGRVGFGPLLTHNQPFVYDRRHELDHQLDLLQRWGVPDECLALARPSLPPIKKSVDDLLAKFVGGVSNYRVLHPSASTVTRDWTVAGWAGLAQKLLTAGITPLVTGQGQREAEVAAAIVVAAPGTINTVGQLAWSELMALLAGSQVVYSVETSVGHAAAALGRPVIALYGGMADPRHWAPLQARVVTHPMACAPCFDRKGCTMRPCLAKIPVEDVEGASEGFRRPEHQN